MKLFSLGCGTRSKPAHDAGFPLRYPRRALTRTATLAVSACIRGFRECHSIVQRAMPGAQTFLPCSLRRGPPGPNAGVGNVQRELLGVRCRTQRYRGHPAVQDITGRMY